MGKNTRQGKAAVIFVVVMGLTAAAAIPLFIQQNRPQAEEAVLPEEPIAETVVSAEPADAPPPKPKPKRRRVTTWNGGGESTTIDTVSVGKTGMAKGPVAPPGSNTGKTLWKVTYTFRDNGGRMQVGHRYEWR